jgi:hypothetical protein
MNAALAIIAAFVVLSIGRRGDDPLPRAAATRGVASSPPSGRFERTPEQVEWSASR